MKRLLKGLSFSGLSLILVLVFFQNCAGKFSLKSLDSSSENGGSNNANNDNGGFTGTPPTNEEVSKLSKPGMIASGNNNTCQISLTGSVWCWGGNLQGQLGNGTVSDSSKTPVQVQGISSAVWVAVGSSMACAVLSDGSVKCWGYNNNGQLGNGSLTTSSTPVTVTDVTDAIQVSVKLDSVCAVLKSGTLKCWGSNAYGQLGNGTQVNSSVPVDVTGLDHVVSVAIGVIHTCALLDTGHIKCWGQSSRGQLGDGTVGGPLQLTPVEVGGISTATQITVGFDSSCALLQSGTIKCWGGNSQLQLGNSTVTNTSSGTPVDVLNVADATMLTTGNYHNCAALKSGKVKCWGYNYVNLLGNASLMYTADAVEVIGITDAINVAASPLHSCLINAKGETLCWGRSGSGQLGINFLEKSLVPIAVPNIQNVTQISGGLQHMCAVTSAGEVKCWGSESNGQIGNNVRIGIVTAVFTVPGIQNAQLVKTENFHTCAIVQGGKVSCWGIIDASSFGWGNKVLDSFTPVEVPGITTAVELAMGNYHTCARLQNGSIQCWGYNHDGQLGDGTSSATVSVPNPVSVVGINNAISITAFNSMSCAVLGDGSVKCWGINNVGLGDSVATLSSPSPISVANITNGIKISSQSDRACVVLSTGGIKCWGLNYSGVLGNGDQVTQPTAVDVAGISNASDVSMGANQTCALLSDQTVKCWGYNGLGGLGDGTLNSSLTAIPVPGLTNVSALGVGGSTVCASRSNGEFKCWGDNTFGQLANMPGGLQPTKITGF